MDHMPEVELQEPVVTAPPEQLKFFRKGPMKGFLEKPTDRLSFNELVTPEGQLVFLTQPITVAFGGKGQSRTAHCEELDCSGSGGDRYLAYRNLCEKILSSSDDAQLARWLLKPLATTQ